MKEIKVNAICVRKIDYKDNKTMLTLCTVEKGKIETMINGAKSEKSKLRFASSLLCFGEYILTEKNGYHTVINCSLIDGFYDLRKDFNRLYSAIAVLEILDKTTISDIDISEYVLKAVKAIKRITYDDLPPFIPLINYIVQIMEILGFQFNLDRCGRCGDTAVENLFDYAIGGGICEKCRGINTVKLNNDTYNTMKDFLRFKTDDKMYNVEVLKEIIKMLSKSLKLHADIKLNSLNQILNF